MKLLDAIKQYDASTDEETGNLLDGEKYREAEKEIMEAILPDGDLEEILNDHEARITALEEKMKHHKHFKGRTVMNI